MIKLRIRKKRKRRKKMLRE